MMSMITSIALLLVVALFILSLAVLNGTKPGTGPRVARRYRGLILWTLSAVFLIAVCLGAVELTMGMQYAGITVFFGGAGTVLAIVLLIRNRGRSAEAEDFVANPRYCARCGYDLTGNVSGVCPECGWTLPSDCPALASRAPATDPEWPLFWKQWRIGHLEQWRTHLKAKLASAATRTVLFAFLFLNAINLARQFSSLRNRLLDPPVLFIAFMLLVLLFGAIISWIQVVRLACYGHRKSKAS